MKLYVSQEPIASDSNVGTEKHPFLTISHACEVAKPGDVVLVAKGVYKSQKTLTVAP
jgi:hypothetical protein